MLLVSANNSDRSHNSLALDSTCSYHMSSRGLIHIVQGNFGYALMGNNASYKVIGMQSVKIKIFNGMVRTLEVVKHVTELRKNLIFLSTLDTGHYSYKSELGALTVKKEAMIVRKGQKLTKNMYKVLGNIVIGGVA